MEILIYSSNYSNRLQYICGFIFKKILELEFSITTDIDRFNNFKGVKINYSEAGFCGDAFHICPATILFEKGIIPQNITCFTLKNNKAFFEMKSGDIDFDIFAASFYLLSRYEEYLPHTKDMYGRFAHENSLAFKEGFLQIPLINIWLQNFSEAIKIKFPTFKGQQANFKFIPTYDIDIAFAYKHKGWVRNIGGFLKMPSIQRIKVLLGTKKDPFDVFEKLMDLHQKFNLQPIYFFLLAGKNSKYDKNISPRNKSMWQLIKKLSEKNTLGIHPSWQSGDVETLVKKEKELLQSISKKVINISRQHYIRFNMPQTFQRLLAAGITEDYSMGYGSINGFRASVATSFYWYDLEKDEQTTLKMHPFCFMDANSFYEQKQFPEEAFNELMKFYKACKTVNGNLITIWHNTILGTDKHFNGWGNMYENFLKNIAAQSN